MLQENEQQNQTIAKLRKQRIRMQRQWKAQMAELERKTKAELQSLNEDIEYKQRMYEGLSHEVAEAVQFKEKTSADPNFLSDQIKTEEDRRKARAVDHERVVAGMRERLKEEQQELEQSVFDKIMRIIDASKSKLSTFFDTSTKKAYRQNARLLHERRLHEEQGTAIEADMVQVLATRERLLEARQRAVDERRVVLALKECMTCTPDMQFEITEPERRVWVA
ncbi:hypothetical protein BDK51DRAFT_50381 [Blyttiomyces helicus]|uniref:Uncharacterized protein n=1 Tax=Blyttiomyces helicus TaxID=388810 RepID=A0A4P9W8R6_9FUNG|nr:hypothetical protein BDK51DRAFT_50381 [Blyttiomyces helicus]|eukprot:RKO87478.1 hypothetical protein BDK51DRAFT_50381 [Blyttiomyces helicus]